MLFKYVLVAGSAYTDTLDDVVVWVNAVQLFRVCVYKCLFVYAWVIGRARACECVYVCVSVYRFGRV